MFQELRTERLLLRRINPEDQHRIYQGLSDPDVTLYYGISFASYAESKAQMDWFSYLEKTRTGLWWAVCSSDNSVFYGAGGFTNIEGKIAEAGFWLLPQFWRQGILKEAFPKMLEYGCQNLGLSRVEGLVDSAHTACKTALQNLKFKYEKTIASRLKNGKFINVDLFSFILAPDFTYSYLMEREPIEQREI